MIPIIEWRFFILVTVLFTVLNVDSKRVSSSRRKGKVQAGGLPFPNVALYSSQKETSLHPKGARIKKASHFSQTYKLGYKILLICEAEGEPRPDVRWYKDGSELPLKSNTYVGQVPLEKGRLKSRVEIDPATIGDQGVYTCLASNEYSSMQKNFKTEYTF